MNPDDTGYYDPEVILKTYTLVILNEADVTEDFIKKNFSSLHWPTIVKYYSHLSCVRNQIMAYL